LSTVVVWALVYRSSTKLDRGRAKAAMHIKKAVASLDSSLS
jgi:hypothetical protein